jgi:hypothetical protein
VKQAELIRVPKPQPAELRHTPGNPSREHKAGDVDVEIALEMGVEDEAPADWLAPRQPADTTEAAPEATIRRVHTPEVCGPLSLYAIHVQQM